MIFFGRPLWASFLVPMWLVAARGFAQDGAIQQQSPPVSTDGTATVAKPAAPAETDPAKQEQAPPPENRAADMNAPPDKHVLGVLPNFRTVNDNGAVPPIDTKHKLMIAM